MEIIQNFIQGKMDKDADVRLIPKGVYRTGTNIRIASSDGEDAGAVRKVKGTFEWKEFTDGAAEAAFTCIGAKVYKNHIYAFYYGTTSTDTYLYEISRLTQTSTLLFKLDLGNAASHIINDIEIVENNDSDRYIYWNDKVTAPKKANITQLKASATYYAIADLDLIKSPPVYAPAIINPVSGDGYELQYKDQIQVAYQYIYEDGEESAVSFYSGTVFDNKDAASDIEFNNVITKDDADTGKIYVSDDFGVSFTRVTPGEASWDDFVQDYCINLRGSKMWLISVDGALEGHPYKSVDGGLTWNQYYGGLALEYRRIKCDSEGKNVYINYETPTHVKLAKSVDGESGWTEIDSIAYTGNVPKELAVNGDGSVIYHIGSTNKIRVSRDSGAIFVTYNLPATFAIADILHGLKCNSIGNIAYLQDITLNKLYRSSDYGQTWIDLTPAASIFIFYNGYAIDASGVIVYALVLDIIGGNIQRVLVSKNAGNTWSHLATFTVGGAIVDSDIECTPDGSKGLFAIDNGSINGYYFESDGTISSDLDGSVVNTQANTPEQVEIDTVTLSGVSGTANVTCDELTKLATFNNDLPTTAANFITDWAAAYDAQNITLTSSGADLIFTGQAGKGAFIGPTIVVNVSPDLGGVRVNTQTYIAPVKRIDTVTLTGTSGTAGILCDAVTRNAIFNGTLTQTAIDFVTVNAAAYLAGGVVVTSSGADIIFTAAVAGVDFTGATTITRIGRTIYGLHIQLQQTLADIEREKFFLRNDISSFEMRIATGSKHVDKIRLLYRHANETTWRVLDELTKALLSIADNTTYDYTFDKSAFNRILSPEISEKLYDNVPHKANSMTLMNNRLFFGGYEDGETLGITPNFAVTQVLPAGVEGLSLKAGTTQKYGIVYYDGANRSSAPLLDPDGSIITFSRVFDEATPLRAARVTITHLPPAWATKFKIVRAKPIIDYRFITGLTDFKAVNEKLYTYIGATQGIYAIGDKLEAISFKSGALVTDNMFVEIEDIIFKDDSFSDPDAGYWIVITPPASGPYSLESVLNGSSSYPFVVFYLIKYDLENPESIYLETPESFAITGGYHIGNTRAQTVAQTAIIDLTDGDVWWAQNPFYIEKYQVAESIPYNALGRGILASENFKKIMRYASMCFSDLFVPDSGYNGLSSFNLGLPNYKDLNIGDGEITLLEPDYTDILVLQEDLVSKVLVNKDVLQTASGEGLLSGSKVVLGQQIPYAGDYGCQNPAAFARWGNAKYFPDKKRGVVLRLSQDGLTEISKYGFRDYFNDLFRTSTILRGAYDPRHSEYILQDVTNAITIGFSEPENGFPSFFTFAPDYIIDDNLQLWSFKGKYLWKHNATTVYNKFYGVQYTSKIAFVFNDEKDIIKVIESIALHGDSAWVVNYIKDRFRTTDIPSANFENKEGYFFASIPKAVGTARANVVTDNISTQGLGIATFVDASNFSIISPSSNQMAIGDEIQYYNAGWVSVGTVTVITDNGDGTSDITVTGVVTAAITGKLAIAQKNSYLEGDSLRDYYFELELEHLGSSDTELFSVVAEVKQSKQ